MKKWISLLLALFLLPLAAHGEEDDYICAQPGDSGGDVQIVLEKAYELGFLKEPPENMDEYLAEYEPAILEMEKALGLTEDGVITLSEITEIENAVRKGSQSPLVKELLERLFDLGYITKILPEPHDVYEASFEAAVKKAEKKLGLRVDGIITDSEWKTIKSQKIAAPEAVKNLKGSGKNKKVTLTWSPVKGAVYYNLYRNSALLAKIPAGRNNRYVDEDVSMGESYSYYIIPRRYSGAGKTSETIYVDVDIIYTQANFKQMKENKDLKFVRFGNSKWISARIQGNDYYITASQTIGGITYTATLIMHDYKYWSGDLITSFSPRNCSGQGRLEVIGDRIMIYLDQIRHW